MGEIPFCHCADDASDFRSGLHEIGDQGIHRVNASCPGSRCHWQRGALLNPSFFSDDSADAIELSCHPLIEINHFVQAVVDLARQSRLFGREPRSEISFLEIGENS